MNIAFSKPTIGQEEQDAVIHTLSTGWLAAGPETASFEEEFSTYISPPGEHYYCIFTNSCTSALKMAYKILKEQGEKILWYPKNTFCATYSAAEEVGLRTIPYTSLEHDPSSIFHRVAVHYGGEKDELDCLVEDSAHRIEPNDPLVGKIRCYSFYVTKNMTTGAGGMFVTNDKEIYERARLYWRDGLTTSTADRLSGFTGYEVKAMAGGYDGNDIGASIGRVQLTKLPLFTKRRNEIRDYYNREFALDWQGNHLYCFPQDDEKAVYTMIAALDAKGIKCSHNYPGTGWNQISLPIYPLLSDTEVEYIAQEVKAYAKN